MALSLLLSIKNDALNDSFKPTNLYLQIPNQVGSQVIYMATSISNASGGVISLATPVQFAVSKSRCIKSHSDK